MNDIKITDLRSKKPVFETAPVTQAEAKAAEPGERIKVKFEKFVQLVATHDFEGALKKHADEDIIVNSNLLTDLANSHEEEAGEGKKFSIFLIVGIIIGIVISFLILR